MASGDAEALEAAAFFTAGTAAAFFTTGEAGFALASGDEAGLAFAETLLEAAIGLAAADFAVPGFAAAGAGAGAGAGAAAR